jgi:hypothetical protein
MGLEKLESDFRAVAFRDVTFCGGIIEVLSVEADGGIGGRGGVGFRLGALTAVKPIVRCAATDMLVTSVSGLALLGGRQGVGLGGSGG